MVSEELIVDRWRSGELLSKAEEIVAKSVIDVWQKSRQQAGCVSVTLDDTDLVFQFLDRDKRFTLFIITNAE